MVNPCSASLFSSESPNFANPQPRPPVSSVHCDRYTKRLHSQHARRNAGLGDSHCHIHTNNTRHLRWCSPAWVCEPMEWHMTELYVCCINISRAQPHTWRRWPSQRLLGRDGWGQDSGPTQAEGRGNLKDRKLVRKEDEVEGLLGRGDDPALKFGG